MDVMLPQEAWYNLPVIPTDGLASLVGGDLLYPMDKRTHLNQSIPSFGTMVALTQRMAIAHWVASNMSSAVKENVVCMQRQG